MGCDAWPVPAAARCRGCGRGCGISHSIHPCPAHIVLTILAFKSASRRLNLNDGISPHLDQGVVSNARGAMRQSEISLPPLVDGPVRGLLRLRLGEVSWAAPDTPDDGPVEVSIAWWGAGSADTVQLPGPAGACGSGSSGGSSAADLAGVAFPLRTGPKYLTRYLRDMGALTIKVTAAGQTAARHAASATVGLLALDVDAPISGSFPLVLTSSQAAGPHADGTPSVVGSMHVCLELDYACGGVDDAHDGAVALLSSFELNEHLASSREPADEERLKAVITRLKHSQQQRHRTSSEAHDPLAAPQRAAGQPSSSLVAQEEATGQPSGPVVAPEEAAGQPKDPLAAPPTAAEHRNDPPFSPEEAAGQPSRQHLPPVPALPAVVVGVPVLPPPPVQQAVSLPAVEAGASVLSTSAPAALGSEPQPNWAPGPAAAGVAAEAQRAADTVEAVEPVAAATALDPLQQLIQQAEKLKAALERASGARGVLAACKPAPPRLPNLLIPMMGGPDTAISGAPCSETADAAGACSLPAATAALLAATRALRLEEARAQAPREQQRQHGQLRRPYPPSPQVEAATAALDSSDAESDAEDALLDALLLSQLPPAPAVADTHKPAALQLWGSPTSALHAQARTEAVSNSSMPGPLVLRVWLRALQPAEGRRLFDSAARCVVKPLRGGQAQCVALPVDCGSVHGADALCVEVAVPAAQHCGTTPVLQPHLFLELWRDSGSLLGVVKVPLPAGAAGQAGAAPPSVPMVAADGWFPVDDLLEGRRVGSMHVSAVLQVRLKSMLALWGSAGAASPCSASPVALKQRLLDLRLQERGSPPLAAALLHSFSVHIRSVLRLPSTAAYASAGLRAPDSRLLRYSFPGEGRAMTGVRLWCVCTARVMCKAFSSHSPRVTYNVMCRGERGAAVKGGGLLQQPLLRRPRQA